MCRSFSGKINLVSYINFQPTDRPTEPATRERDSPGTSTANNTSESRNNYFLAEVFAQMLRNILNFSAQETVVSLERLQRNVRQLMEDSGNMVRAGVQALRDELRETEQNNRTCLLNLYKLRESLDLAYCYCRTNLAIVIHDY